nr:MAG TPA: hypothetical protein [Caudoviricetes sp.]
MIYKKCIMTINKNNATLDEDIYLFRLDKNIELHFSIVNNRYKFDKSDLNNIIAQTNAAYFQIRLYRSDEIKYTFAIQPTQDGVAVLTITDDLINDPIELGEYDFQISLLDADKTSMISMPIVKQQLHVCEPLVDNQAIMGKAVLGLSSLASGEIKNAFDSEGNYIREVHNDGDILSAQLVNKFEEALDSNTKAIKNQDIPHTISSKVLATVPAKDIKLEDMITINNISINKDRRYFIEFLGNKKLCNFIANEEMGDAILCRIGNYAIQVSLETPNITVYIAKINANDTTVDTFTDLVIYEEEVKCIDNKYLENDLVLQNSISLGRVGDIGVGSSAIGTNVIASGFCSHAEGSNTTASGESSHAEGTGTQASGNNSHAEGSYTTASGGFGSHAEGSNTTANGIASHSEGDNTEALGNYSHAEGSSTIASGNNSHAEGSYTTASGEYSHAEGSNTKATGDYAHAEGSYTTASGENSHAEGAGTTASSENQHVQGKYNIEDSENKYAHIVGNGEDGKNSNAHTLDWQGNAWFAGKLSQEGTPTEDKDLTTKKYVDDNAVNKYSQLNERPIEVFPYTEKLNKVTNVTQKLCTIDVADLKADTTYMCPDNCGRLALQYTKLDNSKISFYMSYSPNSLIIQTGYKNDKQIEILIDGIVYTVTFKTATEEPKVEQTVRYLTDKNTTEYTPTGDYNPATKKYVDDNILIEQLPILRIDETNKRIYVNCNNMGTYKKYFVPNKYANVYGFSFIYTNEDSSETEIALIGGAMTRDDFILCTRNTNTLFILILGGTNKYTYTKSTKTLEKGLYGYLKIGNTQEYAPTENYNPATKKYVDDKVASLPQLSFNEAGELVVTINGVSKTFVPKAE